MCMSAASMFKDLNLVTEQWRLTLASCMQSDAMVLACVPERVRLSLSKASCEDLVKLNDTAIVK